ncbi:hypothetical protein LguiA_035154 [Lonicera macranthoides]
MLSIICSSSEAYNFYVGGKDGWVLKPSETYIFKYKKGSDSVLLVNKDDYYRCNKANPIQELNEDHSESIFKFNHSGPFFFISGQADNCEKGQKIIIVVLAVRNKTPIPSPATPLPSPAIRSPSPESPPSESPNGETPESGGVPAPAPAKSDAPAVFGVSGGLVVVLSSVGMSVVLGGLVGLF